MHYTIPQCSCGGLCLLAQEGRWYCASCKERMGGNMNRKKEVVEHVKTVVHCAEEGANT